MTQPHSEFTDDHIPLAYLITFRSYGNWLHGDLAARWIVFIESTGLQCYHPAPKEKGMNSGYSLSNQSR